MALPIVGALIGGITSIFTGKSKAKQAKYQAQIAESQAKQAQIEAQAKQAQALAELEKAKGQKTMYIALGIGALGVGLLSMKKGKR